MEAYDYIIGRKFSDMEEQHPIRCNKEMVDRFVEALKVSPTAYKNLEILDVDKQFFKLEKDVAALIPEEEREEVFYAAKMEKYSPVIPSKYLYLIKLVKEQAGSYNLFPVCLAKGDLEKLFAKGTIAEGYCLKDIICKVFDSSYSPISESVRGVKVEDYWEVVTNNGKAIVFMPDTLRKELSNDDLELIHVKGKRAMFQDIQLRFLSSAYLGICNKIYDLRGLR